MAVVVLDRPNPLGGEAGAIEGGTVEPRCESFVGLGAVPVRHGMTAGEIALTVMSPLPASSLASDLVSAIKAAFEAE